MSEQLCFDDAVKSVKAGTTDANRAAHALFTNLTLEERLSLLDGDQEFWTGMHGLFTEGYNVHPYVHGAVPRLGIPGVRFADGPRGCVLGNASTAFPVPMARGASWDVDLEERIGLAIGRECRAQGANFFGGVCVNLPWHPAWGRIQETYGDDPVLLGEFGAALTRGVQRNVMACVKHYALNSMENARFQVDVSIGLDVLHEVYLAHFRRIVEDGVASVMSSYNSVRGEWAGQNKELLIDILRNQWGFQGFVISDFIFGLRDGPLSVKNGLDIEAPFTNIRSRSVKGALESGEITEQDIRRAGISILRTEIQDAARVEDPTQQSSVVFSDTHRALAREAAVKSMVLLKNSEVDGKPLLPLSTDISKLAVVGRLANSVDTGDRGSSLVRCPDVTSPYAGLKAALPQTKVVLEDSGDLEKAKEAAASANVAIIVVGYNWQDEGEFTIPPFKTNPDLKNILPPQDGSEEAKFVRDLLVNEVAAESTVKGEDNYGLGAGGDRSNLRLKQQDMKLIRAVTAVNSRTIVSIVAAGAVLMSDWDTLPPSILYSWYSGSEGGHALADILFGHANPAGRLPFAIPTTEDHLPPFDKNATAITYDRWFGQHLLDRLNVEAAYPLGFGLSYTSFTVSDLKVDKTGKSDVLKITVSVRNTGKRAGRLSAQVYGVTDVPYRPKRVLLGFGVVDLEVGEEKSVTLEASTRPLQKWDNGTWAIVAKEVTVEVGGYSGDKQVAKANIQL